MTQALSPLLAQLRESEQQFVSIRRDIHAHPELGFAEARTADIVARKLAEFGYDVTTGIGGTGVVGRFKRGESDRAIGLRADMDALPIQESTGLPYASTIERTMHACGHDGHTAILLAAAHHLAKYVRFDGTLNVIFQPAEEGLGGATRMMNDGLFERFPCDKVFALHNAPGLPVGHFALRHGCMMASSDTVTITVKGKGGHGAMPQLACDPIVAASGIVLALQSNVARNVAPTTAAVVTVGSFQSGVAGNVIPDSAVLKLSVRALDAETRNTLEQRIRTIAESQAHAYGATATVEYHSISRTRQRSRCSGACHRGDRSDCGSRGAHADARSRDGQRRLFMDDRAPAGLLRDARQRHRLEGRMHGPQPGIRLQRRRAELGRCVVCSADSALPEGCLIRTHGMGKCGRADDAVL
jgi:hippurate hydrolase